MFSKTPGEDSVRHNSVPAPCYQPGGSDGLVDGMKVPCKCGNVDVLEELSVTKGERGSLRPIVIDGSNVAYCHGEDKKFTIRGLEIVVDDFIIRGSEKKKIVAFLPQKRDHFHPKFRETLKQKCSLSFAPRRHE